jgi:hypothetical protein
MESEIMTDQQMIELEPEILKCCEERIWLRDQLSRLVVKERWPIANDPTGTLKLEYVYNSNHNGDEIGYSTRTYQLQHAAVNSGEIYIASDVDKESVKRSMSDVVCWLWSYYFRDKLLGLIRNRMVVRDLSEIPVDRTLELTRIISSNSKRVNILGKQVDHYIKRPSNFGVTYILNPKYKRSAEQVIFFHPDIVHFQFPDEQQWIGEIRWRNIPDQVTNPDCKIGFYRLVTTAAARPVFPEFGLVATVVPKGIRGLFYYWVWKLFRLIP